MSGTRDTPPRMPRWVKWPAIVLGVLVLVLVVSHLLGIKHGPGMHTPNTPTGTHATGGNHR